MFWQQTAGTPVKNIFYSKLKDAMTMNRNVVPVCFGNKN